MEQADKLRLRQVQPYLDALGVCRRRVKAEGDCLFLSLAVARHGDSSNKQLDAWQMELRSEIADFIQQHRARYEPFVMFSGGFDAWVQRLRSPLLEWGDRVCLEAAATIYRTTIEVLSAPAAGGAPSLITVSPAPWAGVQPVGEAWAILHYGEVHYDALL